MKSGITTSKNGVKIYNLIFALCLRGGCWRQGGATWHCGRGGGAQKALFLRSQAVGRVGDLTVIEQGFRGIDLGKSLHEFISVSHRLQRLALAVSILLVLAAAWSHDSLLLCVCILGQCLPFHVVYHAEQLFWLVLSCVYITPYHLHNTSHYAMHLLQALWYKHNTTQHNSAQEMN